MSTKIPNLVYETEHFYVQRHKQKNKNRYCVTAKNWFKLRWISSSGTHPWTQQVSDTLNPFLNRGLRPGKWLLPNLVEVKEMITFLEMTYPHEATKATTTR